MRLTVDQIVPEKKLREPAGPRLPQRMRLLVVCESQATCQWIRNALQTDAACDTQVIEALGMTAGIECLRDQLFDAILIANHQARLDALDLVAGLRAGGAEEPIVILGHDAEDEMLALALEAGADSYLAIESTTVRALLWTVARGIERHSLVRENRRLQQIEQRRIEHEQREAQHLLLEQRAIVDELETLRQSAQTSTSAGPTQTAATQEQAASPAIFDAYRELLRSYVIMGAGNLATEMERFANVLAGSGLSAREVLQMHLRAVEGLVEGLPSRSTRHVMTRADLLILELMVHLAEWFRERYDQSRS